MTATRLALRIIGALASDLGEPRTIRQIALATDKPYANVHGATRKLLAQGVLTGKTIGHSTACQLNLHSERARILLALACAKEEEHPLGRALRAHGALFAFTSENQTIAVTRIPADVDGVTCLSEREFLASAHALRAGPHILFGALEYARLLEEREARQ
jgi:hypothetical protein